MSSETYHSQAKVVCYGGLLKGKNQWIHCQGMRWFCKEDTRRNEKRKEVVIKIRIWAKPTKLEKKHARSQSKKQ